MYIYTYSLGVLAPQAWPGDSSSKREHRRFDAPPVLPDSPALKSVEDNKGSRGRLYAAIAPRAWLRKM